MIRAASPFLAAAFLLAGAAPAKAAEPTLDQQLAACADQPDDRDENCRCQSRAAWPGLSPAERQALHTGTQLRKRGRDQVSEDELQRTVEALGGEAQARALIGSVSQKLEAQKSGCGGDGPAPATPVPNP